MCDTMATIPLESTSTYVLTEDMIDAAMTEQFSFQDDIESEEELSSQEDAMDVDQDTAESAGGTGGSESGSLPNQNGCSSETTANSETSSFSNNMSVLVIETGLDKSQKASPKQSNNDLINTCNAVTSSTFADKNSDSILNIESDCRSNLPEIEDEMEHTIENGKCSSNEEDPDNKEAVPILKKILSNFPDQGVNNIESIDLCDSDTDEFSEDEITGIESIDDELQSVMENNLMAEIGITVKKRRDQGVIMEKNEQDAPPKISVKNIAHISTQVFDNIREPENTDKDPALYIKRNDFVNSTIIANNNIMMDVNGKESIQTQTSTSIHFNKIAVPHTTYINSDGKRVKCVYVKNSVPVVINTSPANVNNKNIQYVVAPNVKNGPPGQFTPITELTNMTKQNFQPHRVAMPKSSKVLQVAPKLQKPPLLQNNPSISHQYFKDQNFESIIKRLLFHSSKKPYSPAEVPEWHKETYTCLDCNDRFLLESSLNHHLSRRSIIISYWCRICQVELRFFNRCLLLNHLRKHNVSIKTIDMSCIKFSPITKEMVEAGVATTYFKEFTQHGLPNNGSSLQKLNKSKDAKNTNSSAYGIHLNENSVMNNSSLNQECQKITTVAGQSKSVCFRAPDPVIINKSNNYFLGSTIPNKNYTKTSPQLMHNKPMPVQSITVLHNPPRAQSSALNKSAKSVILLCNKLPNKLTNQKPHTAPRTGLNKSGIPKIDTDIIIDDVIEKTNNTVSEEEVDVEIVDNSFSIVDLPGKSILKSDISSSKKTKDKTFVVEASKTVKRICNECGSLCFNISKHLNSCSLSLNHNLACEACKLILPTKCALKIHSRIHMKLPPFICPDCGRKFNSWKELYPHLKLSCGHLAKCMRYLCCSCKAHFPSEDMLSQHIFSKHSREIFKCNLCPVAFYNKQSLSKHLLSSHHNESKLSVGMDYKQCSMCPKKLVPTDKFAAHVKEHTTDRSVLIYGYKCPMCSVIFANKMAFIIHQSKEKREMEGKNEKQKKIPQTKSISKDYICNEGAETIEDSKTDSNSDVEEEPAIVRKYPELNENPIAEKDPLSLDDWELNQEQTVNEKREELCIVCKRNYVVLLPGIDLNDQSLCCKQCVKPLDDVGETFTPNRCSPNTFENSVKRKKSCSKTVQRSSSVDEAKILQKKRRPSDVSPEKEVFDDLFSVSTKKKSRKKPNKEKIDIADQTHIQGQIITSKPHNELVCSKCEYTADSRDEFVGHINAHRTDPNTFLCLECGLCFVVLPSLERHLQMHHGIKDINGYIQQNSLSLPRKLLLVEEDDNRCRVCHETFDCVSTLEKHFRTHGMAFMSTLSKSP